MISDIVASIRASSTSGGGFVRFDMETRRWYEVGDKIARDKVGQSLRTYSPKKNKPTRNPSPRTSAVVSEEFNRASVEPYSSSKATDGSTTLDIQDWIQMKPMASASPMSLFPQHLPAQPAEFATCSTSPNNNQSIDDILRSSIADDKGKNNDRYDDDPSDNSLIEWFEADSMEMR